MRQEVISTVKNEMNNLGQGDLPTKGTSTNKAEKKKSSSEAMTRKKGISNDR